MNREQKSASDNGMGGARMHGPSELELHRLRWQCRRGLLELDLAFDKFLARHAAGLGADELATLNLLLEMGDNALWDVVSGRANCSIPGCGPLLVKLRENWI